MMLKYAVPLVFLISLLAGCEAKDTAPKATVDGPDMQVTKGKPLVGDAGIASVSVPENCEKLSMDTLRSGGSIRVQTGCSVSAEGATVVVALNEITIPFDEAFSVSGDGDTGFREVASVFPRVILAGFVEKSEENALASIDPDWTYSNKKMALLPGNGGVEYASACVQFSFDAISTAPPARKGQTTGLRCARFGESGDTIEEIMLEVLSFHPADQDGPQAYLPISRMAKSSLRYR